MAVATLVRLFFFILSFTNVLLYLGLTPIESSNEEHGLPFSRGVGIWSAHDVYVQCYAPSDAAPPVDDAGDLVGPLVAFPDTSSFSIDYDPTRSDTASAVQGHDSFIEELPEYTPIALPTGSSVARPVRDRPPPPRVRAGTSGYIRTGQWRVGERRS